MLLCMIYYIVLYRTILYCTILYYTILWYAIAHTCHGGPAPAAALPGASRRKRRLLGVEMSAASAGSAGDLPGVRNTLDYINIHSITLKHNNSNNNDNDNDNKDT